MSSSPSPSSDLSSSRKTPATMRERYWSTQHLFGSQDVGEDHGCCAHHRGDREPEGHHRVLAAPVRLPRGAEVLAFSLAMSDPFPEIKSTHSLVAKYVTKPIWDKLSRAVTKTSGFTLAQAIACATEFDNQHCGIYAGDWDSYKAVPARSYHLIRKNSWYMISCAVLRNAKIK